MLLAKGQQAVLQSDEVLISGGGDGVIKLWGLDVEDAGRIYELGDLEDGRAGGESVLTIALDGTFLYSGRVDGEINVWDLETRQLVRTLKVHDHDILTLSVGYGIVFAAAVDGTVTVQEILSQLIRDLTDILEEIRSKIRVDRDLEGSQWNGPRVCFHNTKPKSILCDRR